MLDLTDWENKKYTTRYGTPVRILCIDAPSGQPIVGIDMSVGDVLRWDINGSYINGQGYGLLDGDLINAKTKTEHA